MQTYSDSSTQQKTSPSSSADPSPVESAEGLGMNTLPATAALPYLLASVLTAYPDDGFPEALRLLFSDERLEPEAQKAGAESWESLVQVLYQATSNRDALDDLRSDYIDLFDRGSSANPMYETEYGRNRAMRKASELADLAGFYQAFGFKIDETRLHDMLDHLSVELEFYALMKMKEDALARLMDAEGLDIVQKARHSFLREHLGRLPGAISRRPGVAGHASFGPILRWCSALLDAECRSEGVVPLPLDWISGQSEEELMACGGGCSLETPGGAAAPRTSTPSSSAPSSSAPSSDGLPV